MRKLTTPFLAISAVMLVAAPWIINAAPYESTMGLVQKVFYFHFPSAIMFLLAAMICGINSFRVLFFRNLRADGWALAAAELGLLFGAITLVTGPLWARKAWGVWWVWDARLTSSLMLWMIFAAYLMLRQYGGPGSERLGAGMALFGMLNVPFIYYSVNVWRTMHPPTSVVPTLPADMGLPLLFCFTAFLLMFLALLNLRAGLEHQRMRVEALYLAEDEA
ncbi:MAG: cytochrome c biogenesis protein CcsA [Acidobacteriota bacterium]